MHHITVDVAILLLRSLQSCQYEILPLSVADWGGAYGYARTDGVRVIPVGALGVLGGPRRAATLGGNDAFHCTVEDHGTFQVSPEGFPPIFFWRRTAAATITSTNRTLPQRGESTQTHDQSM